jgi:hypothetical protein
MKKKVFQEKEMVKEDEIISLNHELFSDFSIQKLEERLETDPLALMNLFNMDLLESPCDCKQIDDCGSLACGCDGKNPPPPPPPCPCKVVNLSCTELDVL